MKTIKLEEIVGYLPYKLKAEMLDYKRDYVGKQYDEIIGLKEWSKEGDWCLLTDGGSKPSLDKFKPLLYNISSLTEFREDLGFVPIEWFEIGDDENDSLEYDNGNIKLIRNLKALSKYPSQSEIKYLPYGVIKKLYEWNIDIHNLISRNLAIDIKTLK